MSSIPSFAKGFPSSTAAPSKVFTCAGVSWESTLAVREVLEENDRGYDIYEKLRFAHNHFPHSALTRYALGAPAQLLRDTWKHDRPHLVPLDPKDGARNVDLSRVPEEITRENWSEEKYLGFDGSYSRYLAFFHKEIDRLGPVGTVEQYVFAPSANWQPGKDGQPGPQMLVRLVGGVLHPFIHAGFGLEFADRVTLAEGLAEAAVHKTEILGQLFPPDWPKELTLPGPPAHQLRPPRSVPSSEDSIDTPSPREPRAGRSLLEIYGTFTSSDKLKPAPYDPDSLINDKLKAALEGGRAEEMKKLVEEWSLSDEELADWKDGWERKLEEVAVLVTLLACGTGRKGHAPRVDFFLMHALTSSIFLPSYLQVLSVQHRRILLRSYLLVVLHTALSRGRPRFNPDLLMSYDAYPVAPGFDKDVKKPQEAEAVLGNPAEKNTRNAWLDIISHSLYHPDSHVPKTIRSLVHYANAYGPTPPGGFVGAYLSGGQTHESIPGTAKMDGTIFLRAAGAVMEQMGRPDTGEEEGGWDRSALGYDEAWQ